MLPFLPLRHDQELAILGAQWVAERRGSSTVTLHPFPDQVERRVPAVDALIEDAFGFISVEHTRLETFSGQSHDDRQFHAAFRGTSLKVDLPDDVRALLTLRVGVFDDRDPDVNPVTEAELDLLRTWIARVAPTLPCPRVGRQSNREAEPPEVPFPVWLSRVHDDHPTGGEVTVMRVAPDDLPRLTRQSTETALDKKFPKLIASGTGGAHTVLVLETFDLSLGNPWDFIDAVRSACPSSRALPDTIMVLALAANLTDSGPDGCTVLGFMACDGGVWHPDIEGDTEIHQWPGVVVSAPTM